MLVRCEGALPAGVTAKDLVLAIIGKIGTAGGTGYAIEFGGSTVRALSMEGRMTMCNMSIEAGARAGMVAVDDKTIEIDSTKLKPQVTWGTSPEMVVSIEDRVPDPETQKDPVKREAMERALEYMGLEPNTPMNAINIDKVFIGSCTNSRIEDLRAAANVVKGKRVARNVKLAMVVPGSGLVKAQAEKEGLDRIF